MRDTLDLGRRRRRRRRLVWLTVPLLAAALVLGRGYLGPAAAGAQRLLADLDAAVGEHVAPGYTARLQALRQRNAQLHALLARAAPLAAENEALRAWLGSDAAPEEGCWRPARLATRQADGSFALACTPLPEPGAAVLDETGRLAGVVRETADGLAWADPAGQGAGAVPVLAGSDCGVLSRQGDTLTITGLPRHCALQVGDVVTTADGQWAGMLARDPAPDAAGLTESAPLTDTAGGGSVYFVA